MAEIELQEVTKRYPDGTEAVSSVSLRIADGEFMILVGPSGCGKSTALRMVAGLEDISEGELRIGGQSVNRVPAKNRDVAMVFQNYALYPHMTVRQNLGFALKLQKVPKAEIERMVNAAAEILDLTPQLERRPANLSGGQRQRVAMGRAIVRDPAAFLMDEPLSNLDAKLRVQMRAEIARLQSSLGTTTIYVTHDQTEAMTLGQRVAVMKGGVIQQVDTPAALYENPVNVFVGGFIGSPAMNFLPAWVADGVLQLPIGSAPMPAELSARLGRRSGPVIAGIRPEHFEDAAFVDEASNRMPFRAKIDVVEALGSEIYVYFDVRSFDGASAAGGQAYSAAQFPLLSSGTATVIARLARASRAAVGNTIDLSLDIAELTLFDPETGENIGLRSRVSASHQASSAVSKGPSLNGAEAVSPQPSRR